MVTSITNYANVAANNNIQIQILQMFSKKPHAYRAHTVRVRNLYNQVYPSVSVSLFNNLFL